LRYLPFFDGTHSRNRIEREKGEKNKHNTLIGKEQLIKSSWSYQKEGEKEGITRGALEIPYYVPNLPNFKSPFTATSGKKRGKKGEKRRGSMRTLESFQSVY